MPMDILSYNRHSVPLPSEVEPKPTNRELTPTRPAQGEDHSFNILLFADLVIR
jgi:hypothetical protein